MNGWFPKINSRGLIASGAGEVFVGDRSIGPGHFYDFIHDDLIIFTRPTGPTTEETVIYNLLTDRVEAVEPGGFNRLAAGGGHWLGFIARAPWVLRRGIGRTVVREWHDAAMPAIAPSSGRYVFSTPYQGSDVHTVMLADGPSLEPEAIYTGATMELSVCDSAVCIQEATGVHTRRIIGIRNGLAPEDWSVLTYEQPIVCDGPDGEPWVLSVTQTGLILRPAGARHGYQWTGEWFNPAVRCVRGMFRIAASDGRGTRREDMIDPAAPRVRLDARNPPIFVFNHPVMVIPIHDPAGTSGAAAEIIVNRKAGDHQVVNRPYFMGAGALGSFQGECLGIYSEAIVPAATTTRLLRGHDSQAPWTRPPGLRAWDIPGIELFWYKAQGEQLLEAVGRWRRDVEEMVASWPGDCAVIPGFYCMGGARDGDPPEDLTVDEVQQTLDYLSEIVNRSARIKIIAPFAYERANGITAHPELRVAFELLKAAAPGLVALTPIGSSEEFMEPWKVTIKKFDPTIARGQVHKTTVALGNGVEVVFEKDANDEIHVAVSKDGVLQDRSGLARHVEVKC